MSDAYVPYNDQYEQTKLETLKANIQAAYNNALIKTGNQRLAEQAAMDAANAGAQLIKIYGDQGLQALQIANQSRDSANQSLNTATSAYGQAGQLGVSAADLLSRLQGPSNAFAYDRAVNGINASGLSNAIGALTGSYHPTSFQAMGATSPLTLDSMAGQTSGGSSSIIDQLLGVGAQAQGYAGGAQGAANQATGVSNTALGNQANVGNGNLPFSIPQFNPDGSGNALSNNSANSGSHPPVGGSPPATGGSQGNASNVANPVSGQAPVVSGNGLSYSAPPVGPSVVNNHFYGASPTGDTHTGFSLGTPQYSPQAQSYLNALPNPNNVNVHGYAKLDPYSQQVALSGYAAKGYDPTQLQGQFAAKLPQFGSPRVGLVG